MLSELLTACSSNIGRPPARICSSALCDIILCFPGLRKDTVPNLEHLSALSHPLSVLHMPGRFQIPVSASEDRDARSKTQASSESCHRPHQRECRRGWGLCEGTCQLPFTMLHLGATGGTLPSLHHGSNKVFPLCFHHAIASL